MRRRDEDVPPPEGADDSQEFYAGRLDDAGYGEPSTREEDERNAALLEEAAFGGADFDYATEIDPPQTPLYADPPTASAPPRHSEPRDLDLFDEETQARVDGGKHARQSQVHTERNPEADAHAARELRDMAETRERRELDAPRTIRLTERGERPSVDRAPRSLPLEDQVTAERVHVGASVSPPAHPHRSHPPDDAQNDPNDVPSRMNRARESMRRLAQSSESRTNAWSARPTAPAPAPAPHRTVPVAQQPTLEAPARRNRSDERASLAAHHIRTVRHESARPRDDARDEGRDGSGARSRPSNYDNYAAPVPSYDEDPSWEEVGESAIAHAAPEVHAHAPPRTPPKSDAVKRSAGERATLASPSPVGGEAPNRAASFAKTKLSEERPVERSAPPAAPALEDVAPVAAQHVSRGPSLEDAPLPGRPDIPEQLRSEDLQEASASIVENRIIEKRDEVPPGFVVGVQPIRAPQAMPAAFPTAFPGHPGQGHVAIHGGQGVAQPVTPGHAEPPPGLVATQLGANGRHGGQTIAHPGHIPHVAATGPHQPVHAFPPGTVAHPHLAHLAHVGATGPHPLVAQSQQAFAIQNAHVLASGAHAQLGPTPHTQTYGSRSRVGRFAWFFFGAVFGVCFAFFATGYFSSGGARRDEPQFPPPAQTVPMNAPTALGAPNAPTAVPVNTTPTAPVLGTPVGNLPSGIATTNANGVPTGYAPPMAVAPPVLSAVSTGAPATVAAAPTAPSVVVPPASVVIAPPPPATTPTASHTAVRTVSASALPAAAPAAPAAAPRPRPAAAAPAPAPRPAKSDDSKNLLNDALNP